MLQHENTNMNMSGSSVQGETTIATFTGNYGGNKDLYVYINMSDYTAALANLDTLNDDVVAFLGALLQNVVDLND